MAEKEYKTYRQLLSILRSRGMVIEKGSSGSRVMRILERENYYNVINGYKSLFLLTPQTTQMDEKYKPGTTFNEVYSLYCFDRDLRNIYLKYLLKIENMFKTIISHEFSAKYGYDNYLKSENFQVSASIDTNHLKWIAKRRNFSYPKDLTEIKQASMEENISSVIKLIGDIQQEIARQLSKHHQVVTHYMTQHGYLPLWVLVDVLTFGKITNFYNNMKPVDKTIVARKFKLQPDELFKYMEMLGLARNKCAHDERFFDIRFRRRIHTKSIQNFNRLGIVAEPDGSYNHGTNDAYAIAIMFALLLSKTELNEFITAMKGAFSKLERQLAVISIDDVMQEMGFGSNWKNLTLLKK